MCITSEQSKVVGLKITPTNQTLPPPSIENVVFLQRLIKSEGTTEPFPPDFPHAIHQALALPLAKPGMLWANIMRSVYMLAAVGAEVIATACLMNLCQERLLTITGGTLEAIPTVEVELEDFDFEGNPHGEV